MHYLDPAFLLPPQGTTNDVQMDVEVELNALIERREEKLVCLGVQRISVDELLQLIPTLTSGKAGVPLSCTPTYFYELICVFFLIEELSRPGMLYALMANIDLGFRCALQQRRQHYYYYKNTTWQRRCICALRHVRIFSLFNGRLVSLNELTESNDSRLWHRNPPMIPPRPPASADPNSMTVYSMALPFVALKNPFFVNFSLLFCFA